MHLCKSDILLTWCNMTLFTLFDLTFSFIIVVIESWILFSFWCSSGKSAKQLIRNIDSFIQQQLNAWNEPAPVFEISLLAHELFEVFLTNTKMEGICIESLNYTNLRGNHIVTMTVEELKVFLTILLVSRYAELPRQDMYW